MAHRSIKRLVVAACAVLVAGGWSSAASALTCSVSAPGVAFGNYHPKSTAAHEGVGNINVSCDGTVGYSIALSHGYSGSYSERKLVNGHSHLHYNLYTSASRTTIWGDGSGHTSTVSGTGGDHTVYGRIPAHQNVHQGVYTDSIVVTVAY